MHNKRDRLYFSVIEEYFKNKSSLRKTAEKFNLHYQTVFKWIRYYRKFGGPPLFKPWNRPPPKIEFEVIKYKEHFPWHTLKQAHKLLLKKGIKISYRGIWDIWKRYGYCGFEKGKVSNDFTDFITLTKETKLKLIQAERLFNDGKIRESAKVLNSIFWMPKNELVLKVPEELLNTRRRMERVMMEFGKIPISEYVRKVKILHQKCIKNQWNYSALRIGLALLVALSWLGNPEEQKNGQKG